MPDPISPFHKRKLERTEYYKKFVYKWKGIPCGACQGSGYYDHNGSPKCGWCDGTGKTKVSPEYYSEWKKYKSESKK